MSPFTATHQPLFVNHLSTSKQCAAPTDNAHDYTVLALYTAGRAQMQQGGQLCFEPGDAHLIPAGAPHRSLSREKVELWGLGFYASSLASSSLAPLLEPFSRVRSGACAKVSIPSHRQAHLASLYQELQREVSAGALGSDLVQQSLLSLILTEVMRASSLGEPPRAGPSLVGEALSYIERNCLRPISLGDVAKAVKRSPAYVTTALKEATGKSAVSWIIAGRLAETRRRLLYTDEAIEQITERVGYSDPTHLIRLFRREHGETPSAWRAKQKRRLESA